MLRYLDMTDKTSFLNKSKMVFSRISFLLLLCIFLCDSKSRKKRILMSDPDFARQELHSIQTSIQDLNVQLSQYKIKLTTYENQMSVQQLKLTTQENKVLQQEQKLSEQENKITEQQAVLQNITKNLTDVMYHNFYDEMAQAMCAAVVDHNAYVYAIRRDCSGIGPICNDICSTAAPHIQRPNMKVSCFDAFSIQKVHDQLLPNPGPGQTDAGKPFMNVYRYNQGGCTFTANVCGPNYCCCKMQ